MSHVIYAKQGHMPLVPSRVGEGFFVVILGENLGGTTARRLSLFLQQTFPLIVGIERMLGIALLVYLGYVSQWYLPLVLYAIGLIGQFILVRIETAIGLHKRAWAISLAGLPVLPIILVYMFYVAAAFK
jgi:hypothetical protein